MSIEFVFRIVGMILFGSGGVWLGVHLSNLAGDPSELWATVFGLAGMLVGLILTPYISIRPIRSAPFITWQDFRSHFICQHYWFGGRITDLWSPGIPAFSLTPAIQSGATHRGGRIDMLFWRDCLCFSSERYFLGVV